MSSLNLMVTIINRYRIKHFTDFYIAQGLTVSCITLGMGTASSEILDYFGLDGSEKGVFFHVVTDDAWKKVKRALRSQMQIDVPGIGIAFLVPLSSIGGKKALNYLINGQEFQKEEESTLKETKYELLTVIANQGYTDMIMMPRVKCMRRAAP